MAEDAIGYPDKIRGQGKNIPIVDDINDTGATFNWIKKDWPAGCLSDHEVRILYGNNVKFAVPTENFASECNDVTYYRLEVNKAHEDVWLVYPGKMLVSMRDDLMVQQQVENVWQHMVESMLKRQVESK